MSIWFSAARDNAPILSIFATVLVAIIGGTIAIVLKKDVTDKAKTLCTCACVVTSVIVCIFGYLVLYDAAYTILPNVIGKPKDEAARMIEDKMIVKPLFTGVPASEVDTIIALFDDHGKALHAGERVPRNIQIVGHYAIPPTSEPTAIPTPEPTATPTPKPTATATATPMPTPDPKVGDRLAFGSYQGEAIEWRVLAVEDNRMLVISEQILDARPYNEMRIGVTWETSTLRAWLNNYFYSAAFTEAEKARIAETIMINSNNSKYNTIGGNSTLDKVFLLSIEEADNYFSGDEDRRAKGTSYTKTQGLIVYRDTEMGRWWLRSPGYYPSYAACVSFVGTLFPEGYNVHNGAVGVRPALWLNQ